MSDEETAPKMTPEEHKILGESPADTPYLLDDEEEAEAPEGVVGDDDRP